MTNLIVLRFRKATFGAIKGEREDTCLVYPIRKVVFSSRRAYDESVLASFCYVSRPNQIAKDQFIIYYYLVAL